MTAAPELARRARRLHDEYKLDPRIMQQVEEALRSGHVDPQLEEQQIRMIELAELRTANASLSRENDDLRRSAEYARQEVEIVREASRFFERELDPLTQSS